MNELKTYLVKYMVYSSEDRPLKSGTMKVKNAYSDLHAKSKLEDFLKKKVPGFNRLVVIQCKPEGLFDDIFNQFSDIFGGKL